MKSYSVGYNNYKSLMENIFLQCLKMYIINIHNFILYLMTITFLFKMTKYKKYLLITVRKNSDKLS